MDEFATGNAFGCRKTHGFRFAPPVATFLRPVRGVPTAICLGFGVKLHKAEGLPNFHAFANRTHERNIFDVEHRFTDGDVPSVMLTIVAG